MNTTPFVSEFILSNPKEVTNKLLTLPEKHPIKPLDGIFGTCNDSFL